MVLEKTLESPLDYKEIQPVHPKWDQSWVFIGGCKELMHLKRLWRWERCRAGGEGDDRGWGGWMASPTQLTCVWVDSRSWWWTGRPGVLQSWGRLESDTTERLNWTKLKWLLFWYLILQRRPRHYHSHYHIVWLVSVTFYRS